MPKLNFTDVGDLQDYRYSVATINSIDTATDTCMLSTGEIALIFYHCTPDSVLRDNGAIIGGAEGFAVGSGVVVLKKFDNSKIYVIGHTDGIRPCQELGLTTEWIPPEHSGWTDFIAPLIYPNVHFVAYAIRRLRVTTGRPGSYHVDYAIQGGLLEAVFNWGGPYGVEEYGTMGPFITDFPVSWSVDCSAGHICDISGMFWAGANFLGGSGINTTGVGNNDFTITVSYTSPMEAPYIWKSFTPEQGWTDHNAMAPYVSSLITTWPYISVSL